MWRLEGDRSAGEHHEREGGVGAVESVGAARDEADFGVERFGPALVDLEPDRVEDRFAVTADCVREPDERLKAAADRFADEPFDQDGDVLERQTRGEDRAKGFLEGVGAPDFAAGGLHPTQRDGLFLVEFLGCLQQRPARVLEPTGRGLVTVASQLVPVAAADLVQRPVGERDDVIRVDRDDRVRGVLAGALGVAGTHIERDHLDRARARLPEILEELFGGRLAVAVRAPHDLPAYVIGDEAWPGGQLRCLPLRLVALGRKPPQAAGREGATPRQSMVNAQNTILHARPRDGAWRHLRPKQQLAALIAACLLSALSVTPAFARSHTVMIQGDSIVESTGIRTPGTLNGLGTMVSGSLNRLGTPAASPAFIPAHSIGGNYWPWRSHGNWTYEATLWSPLSTWGADGYPSTTDDPHASMSGPVHGNSFAVLYATQPGGGSFTFTVGGVSRRITTNGGLGGGGKTWISTPTMGQHIAFISAVSGLVHFTGLLERDSTRDRILLEQVGHTGARSSDDMSRAQREALVALQPDLTILMWGTIDEGAYAGGDSTAPAKFAQTLGQRANIARRTGRCVIVPHAPNGRPSALQARFYKIAKHVSSAHHCVFADSFANLWGVDSQSQGRTVDGVHPTLAGYSLMSAHLARMIRDLAYRWWHFPSPTTRPHLASVTRPHNASARPLATRSGPKTRVRVSQANSASSSPITAWNRLAPLRLSPCAASSTVQQGTSGRRRSTPLW